VTDYADVPPEVLAQVRAVCAALPDTNEQQAWVGRRWVVRKRTFAHVFTVDSAAGPTTAMQFRATGPELEMLLRAGHPFAKAGWGNNVMVMVIDDNTDWDEVRELITESYCVMAPKKLAARVDRPQ
jgi:hypothetical protein